jgi:hypothetical protein
MVKVFRFREIKVYYFSNNPKFDYTQNFSAMKLYFTLILSFLTICLNAQNSPETAVRIPHYNSYQIQFNNQAAPVGLNYDCADDLSNSAWFYFPVCDTVDIVLDLLRSQDDTFDIVIYGPFADTINILSQLSSAPVFSCYNNYPNSPWNFDITEQCNPGIYYMMINKKAGLSQNNNISIDLYQSGPLDLRSWIDSHCQVCNGLTYLRKDICILDFDTIHQKNKLIWEKADTTNISGYVVLRENNVFGTFDSLDFISVDSLSEYVDMSANPMTRVWRYRFVAVDICGNYPDELSQANSFQRFVTLFLQQGVSSLGSISLNWNAGINLHPNLGSIPFLPSFYVLHGTTPNNLTVIDSLPTQIFNYTHVNPVPGPNYYQIEMRSTSSCTSSLLPTYTKAGSNVMGALFTGLSEVSPELSFVIQPNPAKEKFTILLSGTAKSMQNIVNIYTLNGQLVKNVQLANTQPEISISELNPGVYMVVLKNEKGINRQKLVVN